MWQLINAGLTQSPIKMEKHFSQIALSESLADGLLFCIFPQVLSDTMGIGGL